MTEEDPRFVQETCVTEEDVIRFVQWSQMETLARAAKALDGGEAPQSPRQLYSARADARST